MFDTLGRFLRMFAVDGLIDIAAMRSEAAAVGVIRLS